MFAALVPLLVVDVINPVLFALMIVAVGTNRPLTNSTALLAGHTFAYICSGIVIALALEQITERFNNPVPVDFLIELLIGLLCLWTAQAARGGKASERSKSGAKLTPVYCFGYGAVVNFIGIPFALPYFAVVDQVLKANYSIESSLLILLIYNLAYALPYTLVPLAYAFVGESSKPILFKINNILVGVADRFMPILLLVIGIALVADALAYLISGETLW